MLKNSKTNGTGWKCTVKHLRDLAVVFKPYGINLPAALHMNPYGFALHNIILSVSQI